MPRQFIGGHRVSQAFDPTKCPKCHSPLFGHLVSVEETPMKDGLPEPLPKGKRFICKTCLLSEEPNYIVFEDGRVFNWRAIPDVFQWIEVTP